MRYKIFVDLDGVLADFDRLTFELTGKTREELTDKEVWDCVNSVPDFFFSLPLTPDAYDLVNGIVVGLGQDINILTATGNDFVGVGTQKLRWLDKMFRGLGLRESARLTNKGIYKAAYARPNHILIDDTQKVIDAWVAAGGIGILHTGAHKTLLNLHRVLTDEKLIC
jgi:hypothetical protein